MPGSRTNSHRVRLSVLMLWAGVGLAAICGGQNVWAAEDGESAEERFADRENRYRIQPGDVLSFKFRFTPEYDQTVKVQPDGYVSIPAVEDLKVGGLNLAEVRAAVVEACNDELHEPVVKVALEQFNLPAFTVGGEVRSPGHFEMKGDVMLSEAIQMAGGFGSNAQVEQVFLFRRASGKWMESLQVNFKKLIHGGLHEDIRLRPGDLIFIPQSKMANVKRFMEAARVALFFAPLGLL